MKREAAFTLIELMIGASILAFVLTALLLAITNYSRFSKMARDITVACDHAEYVLEEIKNSPISNITATNWRQWARDQNLTGLDFGANLETINVTTSGTNPLLVNLRVSWDDRGATRGIDFYTKVSE